MTQALTRSEHHLLDWLSKEDASAYGECKGSALDRLIDAGFARIVSNDPRGRDYSSVALTDAGIALRHQVGAWEPQP